MKTRIAALIAALMVTASSASAAVVGLQVVLDLDGLPQVIQRSNNNFVSLWSFNNSEAVNPEAGIVTIDEAADILAGFTEGAESIVAFYNGRNPVNALASEFDPLTYSFEIANDARLPESLWIEWTGGRLTYTQPNRTESTVNAAVVTVPVDPIPVIPVPAAMPLLLLGAGALGLMARRRKAA